MDTETCIRDCIECHRLCLRVIAYLQMEGGPSAESPQIRLLIDCAQICRTCADFMNRRSALNAAVCGVCADICGSCARACERLAGDELMRDCAEACRRCAQRCREMSRVAA